MLAVLTLPLAAQDLASFEKRVTVKTLPNGLTVLILRRPEAPVFSFFTMVDAGSAQDPLSQTGLAHMMEHMAFKGTPDIGTTNYAEEKVALAKVEQTYAAYEAERIKRVGRDPQKLAQLQKEWQDAIAAADKFVIKNQFGEIVESHGGVGMNAGTSYDDTSYMYSMPSNMIELWAAIESRPLRQPGDARVLQGAQRGDGRAPHAHRQQPDRTPDRAVSRHRVRRQSVPPADRRLCLRPAVVLGHRCDELLPPAITCPATWSSRWWAISIPHQVMPIVERYFGQLPAKPKPAELTTVEPPQNSVREVKMHDQAQPIYVEGYHRPSYLDPDDAVYDAITDIMSNGRTSRMFRSLVRDQKIAAAAAGFSGFPGTKYAHLFAFYGVPLPGHTNQEMQKAHSGADRQTEDARRHRRRAADVQDAHQGRPHPRAGQQ